jgi:beta-lactam-binding protein with PASTA domain
MPSFAFSHHKGQAIEALNNLGVTNITIRESRNSNYNNDLVIATTPGAGEPIDANTQVILEVNVNSGN